MLAPGTYAGLSAWVSRIFVLVACRLSECFIYPTWEMWAPCSLGLLIHVFPAACIPRRQHCQHGQPVWALWRGACAHLHAAAAAGAGVPALVPDRAQVRPGRSRAGSSARFTGWVGFSARKCIGVDLAVEESLGCARGGAISDGALRGLGRFASFAPPMSLPQGTALPTCLPLTAVPMPPQPRHARPPGTSRAPTCW